MRETFRPVRVTEPKPGIFVYDLGQNFAGWPSMTVSGRAGASIRLTCGELLDSEGLVIQRSQADAPSYFSYTLKGVANENWTPRFSYWGFRYVQVQGGAPEEKHRSNTPAIRKLEGQFVYLDTKQTGRFSSSNELLNRIHSLIVAAMKSNLEHVITDCPHREKLGWLEQDYLMGPSLLYNWDLRTLLPKVIRDTREAQLANGLVPDIAPEYPVFSQGFRDSPEWGSAAIILPSLARQWYGDLQPLRDNYTAMRRYNAYLTERARNGVLRFGLGDWYDIGPGQPGPSKLTPAGLTATATWIWDLQILANTAQLLSRSSDAQAFASQLKLEKVAFQTAFFNQSPLSYGTGSQTALAMPLQVGIAKPEDRRVLAETLARNIRSVGNHTTAGDIGYRYVIEALMDSGQNGLLFDMATEKTGPSYAGQIAAGATALTEAWDANPADSQNHLMLGHIEEWFYGGLAGIRPDPDSPGLTHVNIDPQPVGDLQSVDASCDTVHGPISVNWQIKNGTFTMRLDLPPGVSADLTVPASSPDQVWISGRLASQDSDLQLRSGTKHVSYSIKSGRYEIAVKNFSSR